MKIRNKCVFQNVKLSLYIKNFEGAVSWKIQIDLNEFSSVQIEDVSWNFSKKKSHGYKETSRKQREEMVRVTDFVVNTHTGTLHMGSVHELPTGLQFMFVQLWFQLWVSLASFIVGSVWVVLFQKNVWGWPTF